MRLKLQHINKVASAAIRLDGLTVITGANSTGKSTIGKMLFSLVKATANAKDSSRNNKGVRLEKHLRSLYGHLNGQFAREENPIWDSLFPLPMCRLLDHLLQMEAGAQLETFLNERRAAITQMALSPRMTSLILQDLKQIQICLEDTDSSTADWATKLRHLMDGEFGGSVCSLGTDISSAAIAMENESEYVSVIFKDNHIDKVHSMAGMDLQDATYIESPLCLHLLECLMNSDTFRKLGSRSYSSGRVIPLHVKDLVEKIDAKRFAGETGTGVSNLLRSITGGLFRFDARKRCLVFEKEGTAFSPIQVAAGIKSFGLIQLLIDTNAINGHKVLIWDEPECHLHPEWQIELAKVLVQLTKMGIPILISTQSPYLVQGIRFFSAKYAIEHFVNYYLAREREDGLSVFTDVTGSLNELFSQLAAPLNEIMNVDFARQNQEAP